MTRENLRERKVWGQRNREKMGREAQAEGETLKKNLSSCHLSLVKM